MGSHFSLLQREEERKGQGLRMGEGNPPKVKIELLTRRVYRADGVGGQQEMERNKAADRDSWARQHAWLLLNFFHFLWVILSTSTVESSEFSAG